MPIGGAFDSQNPTIITVSDRSDTTRWIHDFGGEHVVLGVHGLGRRNVWAARLDEAVHNARGKVVVVAESVSSFAVAWWARLSPVAYVSDVVGALLLDPLGTGVAGPSINLKHFSAPSTPLPFPSILYTDANTAEAGAQAATLATNWGSRFVHATALDLVVQGEGCDSEAERALAVRLRDVVSGRSDYELRPYPAAAMHLERRLWGR